MLFKSKYIYIYIDLFLELTQKFQLNQLKINLLYMNFTNQW